MSDTKGTRVYGASDDLIEFDGDLRGEFGYYADDSDDTLGCLLAFSDGTILAARYGKPGLGVWALAVLRQGDLFDRIEVCSDEDADPYSDQVFFKPGALKAWAGETARRVR